MQTEHPGQGSEGAGRGVPTSASCVLLPLCLGLGSWQQPREAVRQVESSCSHLGAGEALYWAPLPCLFLGLAGPQATETTHLGALPQYMFPPLPARDLIQ